VSLHRSGELRVLHSVTPYLNLTENWIGPQVREVPGVRGRVLCDAVANEDRFPLPDGSIVDPPAASWPASLRWRMTARAQALGRNRLRSEIRVRWWAPSLIHAHFGPRAWQTMHLAKRLGIPMVASFYGYDAWQLPAREPVWTDRYEGLFAFARFFLVEGPAMGRRLNVLGCPADKIIVQRISVDLAVLRFRLRNFTAPLGVIMVGRFTEKKGLPDGLRACGVARSRGADLRVTVVGDAIANDRAGQRIGEELRALAQSPELAGAVRFTGFLPTADTADLMESMDVLLCPSRHAVSGDAEGGSPVVLTEAMASGLFCVGTRHCDIPEVVIDGQTGILCDEGDAVAMADALLWAVRQPSLAAAATMRGRRHIEERFSSHNQLPALRSIYETVIRKR
jgi:colanic acid/amylovoran biosynthesis glycosyltransferase